MLWLWALSCMLGMLTGVGLLVASVSRASLGMLQR